MRIFMVALMVTLFAVPFAAQADVLELYPASTITVPACSPTGGSSVVIPKGYYQIHVGVAPAVVCYKATCNTGGMDRVKGNHGATWLAVDTTVSCRSAAGAVVQFVPGGVKK